MSNLKIFRRTKSTAFLNDAKKHEDEYKSNSPDKPLHESVESYFSTASGFTNFRGLLNLMIILLVVSNFRVALENIIKYGILVRPFLITELLFSDPYHWPCVYLLIVSNVFILTIFAIENLLAKQKISFKSGLFLEIIILTSMLLYSIYIILLLHPNPLFSAPVLCIYSVIFLKLWSYIHVNKWCRDERDRSLIDKSSRHQRNIAGHNNNTTSITSMNNTHGHRKNQRHSSDDLSNFLDLANNEDAQIESPMKMNRADLAEILNYQCYPHNLTLANLYYFMLCPTLCYELNFPRTLKIRKRFLLKRTLELIFLPQLMFFLIQQWIMPLLHNSVRPFSQSELLVVVERCLKLAIPNHLIWLMFFYVVFHSALNVCAELLYFADRLFYKDWWNANSVFEFWSTWNIPVHRWARRHIFKPLLSRNYNKFVASVIVFLISALFHELVVSVPLRMFRLWSFSAMIGQVPFAILVNRFLRHHDQLGNFAVWISLIIGQPLAMVMYFHDYYVLQAQQQHSHINH